MLADHDDDDDVLALAGGDMGQSDMGESDMGRSDIGCRFLLDAGLACVLFRVV